MDPVARARTPVAPALEVVPAASRDNIARWVAAGAVGFTVLGVILRVARYATHQPLWGDEAYLAASLIDRGYLDLLRPLDYHQVAPPLFLWAEHAAIDLLGFNEWSLRLVPLVSGVVAVLLFHLVATATLRGVPRLLSIAIFAVAFYPIRYASEVKPYATDGAVALALLALALAAWRRSEEVRWLWFLAAFTPIALGLSHPAVFLAGGIALWTLARLCRDTRRPFILATLAVATAVAVSFAFWFLLVTRSQAVSAGAETQAYWSQAFPPLDRPFRVPLWMLQVHTSHAFAYPIGEARGGSTATTVLFLIGALTLWRRGPRPLLGLLLAPFALGLLAAFLGRYPYGGSTRTMQYVAPSIVLLAGLGGATLIGRARRQPAALAVAASVLLLIGLGTITGDILRPYKFPEDRIARDFARRFWTGSDGDGETICARRDLGLTFDARHWETGRSAVYLCHQAMFSRRHRRGESPEWSRVDAAHPLRCVLYNCDLLDPDYQRWLAELSAKGNLDIRSHVQLTAVPPHVVGGLVYEDRYDVLELVPRTPGAVEALASRAGSRASTAPTRAR